MTDTIQEINFDNDEKPTATVPVITDSVNVDTSGTLNELNKFLNVNQQELNLTDADTRKKDSLIRSIQSTEIIYDKQSKKIIYPANCGGYSKGGDLESLTLEQLEKIRSVQINIVALGTTAAMTTGGLVLVSSHFEGKFPDNLTGLTNGLRMGKDEINDCILEILLENDSMADTLKDPKIRLGLLLATIVGQVVSTNALLRKKPQKQESTINDKSPETIFNLTPSQSVQLNNMSNENNNNYNIVSTNNNNQKPQPRKRGRPPGKYGAYNTRNK